MRSLAVLFLASCMAGAAAKKPDFSGEWTLNLDRSEYGAQPAPKKLVQRIEHKEPTVKVAASEVSPLDLEVKTDLVYSTDGKEVSNQMLGTAVKSTVKWEGEELVIQSRAEFGGRSVEMKDRWRLVEAGTTLIVQRHIEGVAGAFDQTLVLDKK